MLFTDSRGNQIAKPEDAPVSWRVAVYTVVWQDGRLLMVRSGDGHWVLPGGGVEDGETITAAGVRECAEETGYIISIDSNRPLYVREQPFYHSGSERFYHSLQLFYSAKLVNSQPDVGLMTEHDKHRESTWVDVRVLSEESLHPTMREFMKLPIEFS
jgi:8-oxo-dGTP pyrophosphatase MutT (NUDIX family)